MSGFAPGRNIIIYLLNFEKFILDSSLREAHDFRATRQPKAIKKQQFLERLDGHVGSKKEPPRHDSKG